MSWTFHESAPESSVDLIIDPGPRGEWIVWTEACLVGSPPPATLVLLRTCEWGLGHGPLGREQGVAEGVWVGGIGRTAGGVERARVEEG